MLPPTVEVLRDLAGFQDMDGVLAASRELRRIHPRLVETADGLELVWS